MIRLSRQIWALLAVVPLWSAHAKTERYLTPACHKPFATELYAAENFETFPCDLKLFKKKQKIWVIGEAHQYLLKNPEIAADKKLLLEKYAKFWKMVEAGAAAGQLFFLKEGMLVAVDGHPVNTDFYAERMKQKVASFGVEDSFAYFSGMFVVIQISMQGVMLQTLTAPQELRSQAVDQLRFYLAWMFEMIWSVPYVQHAWDQLERPLKDPDIEKLAKKFDELNCDPDYEKIAETLKGASAGELYDLVGVIGQVSEKLAQLYPSIHTQQVSLPLKRMAEIMPKINSSELYEKASSWQSEIMDASSAAREPLMAANVAKVYCAMLETKMDQPLVLEVGSKHAAPIIERLKTMAKNSGLDPNLIKTREPILTKKEEQ